MIAVLATCVMGFLCIRQWILLFTQTVSLFSKVMSKMPLRDLSYASVDFTWVKSRSVT